jgi:transcriptional regulator with XRE-family HTH domain
VIEATLKERIGKRLEFFRGRASLTQEDLALKMGYKSKSSMISQIERGITGMSVEQAIKAAKILNVHPSALLSEKDLSNDDLLILSDFLTLLTSEKKQNLDAIKTLIQASL